MNPGSGKFSKRRSAKKFRKKGKDTSEEVLPIRSREAFDRWLFFVEKAPKEYFGDDDWENIRRK
jgi:hypothetical protein